MNEEEGSILPPSSLNDYRYRDFVIRAESLYLFLHLQMTIRNRSRRNLQEEAIVNP